MAVLALPLKWKCSPLSFALPWGAGYCWAPPSIVVTRLPSHRPWNVLTLAKSPACQIKEKQVESIYMQHSKVYGGAEDKWNKTTLVSCPKGFHFPLYNQLISFPSVHLPRVQLRYAFLCTLTTVSGRHHVTGNWLSYSLFSVYRGSRSTSVHTHCSSSQAGREGSSLLAPLKTLVPLTLGSHRCHCNDKCTACLHPKYTFKSLWSITTFPTKLTMYLSSVLVTNT